MTEATPTAKRHAAKKAASPEKVSAARNGSAEAGSPAKAAKTAGPGGPPAQASSVQKATARKVPARKPPSSKARAKRAVTASPAGRAPTSKATAGKATAEASSARKAAATKALAAEPRPAAPFATAWLARQEAALIEERATYVRQADSLQAEADALVVDFQSGDSQFDEDGGEGDTLSSERERDLTLSAQARAAVEEIDHALAKFACGTYGICEASGEPIPTERLEAIPWARVQVRYKTGGIGRP